MDLLIIENKIKELLSSQITWKEVAKISDVKKATFYRLKQQNKDGNLDLEGIKYKTIKELSAVSDCLLEVS